MVISTNRIAPVAIVLPSRATASFPPASCLGHDPGADHRGEQEEGADAFRRQPARERAARLSHRPAGRGRLSIRRLEQPIRLREGGALALALDSGGIRQAPMFARGISGPDRAGLARRIVADRDHMIDARRVRAGELVPALRAQPVRWKATLRQAARSAIGCTSPLGKEPAEQARHRPSPSRFSSASARIERAELPVQRKRIVRSLTPWRSRRARRAAAGMAGAQQLASRGVGGEGGQSGAVAIDGRRAIGEEGLPDHAVRIGDPALLGFGVAAGGRAFVQHRAVGGLQPAIDLGEFALVLDLDTEMLDPGPGVIAAGNGEVDARILEHPLRIIGLHHDGGRAEQGRVES